MRFKVRIDGVEHQVDANADGTVSLGGETFEARIGRPSDDRRTVQLGEKSYEVRVVENSAAAGTFMLEVAGERVPVTLTDVFKGVSTGGGTAGARGGEAAGALASGAGAAGAAGNGDQTPAKTPDEVKEGVWAPVPGKIVDVLVKAGDIVREGDPVLILEAMKMENELRASKPGTVAAVLVRKGDQAERGQLLIAFE